MENPKLSTSYKQNMKKECGKNVEKCRINVYIRAKTKKSLDNYVFNEELTQSQAVDIILTEYLKIYGDLEK